MANVYTTYDATLGAMTLRQVQNVNVTSNGQVIDGTMSDGLLGQLFGGQKDVRATITTQDIASVAAYPSQSIAAGTITIPMERRADMATYMGGANHYSLSGSRGMVIANSFTAQDTGAATADVETIFLSGDGVTPPVTENTAVSLGAQGFTGLYALGPVTLNGVLVDCARSVTINTGVRIEPYWCNGNNYAITAHNKPPIKPTITVEGPGIHQFLGAIGGWVTGSSLVVYFRKRTTSGFVANGTAQHVKFTFADGLVDASLSAANGGDASKTVTFHGEALIITPNSVIA